jgi:hypothetical protein
MVRGGPVFGTSDTGMVFLNSSNVLLASGQLLPSRLQLGRDAAEVPGQLRLLRRVQLVLRRA